jgi:hypothetical protein
MNKICKKQIQNKIKCFYALSILNHSDIVCALSILNHCDIVCALGILDTPINAVEVAIDAFLNIPHIILHIIDDA